MTLAEAIKSETAIRKAIDNTPNEAQLKAMQTISLLVYDPLCVKFGKIPFQSFFRCEKLNKAVGGASSSQHVKGEAIDLDADGVNGLTNSQLFDYIRNNMEYDQAIWEFGTDASPAWVHVSFSSTHNRKQCLKAFKKGGKTQYIQI